MNLQSILLCCHCNSLSQQPSWIYIAPVFSAIAAGIAAILTYVTYRKNVNIANVKLINDGLNWLKQDTYDIVKIENDIRVNWAARNIAEHPYNKATYLLLDFENLYNLAQTNTEDKKLLTQQIQYLYRVMYRDRLKAIYDGSVSFVRNKQNETLFGYNISVEYVFVFEQAEKKLGI